MKIACIIPTLNGIKSIAKLLDSLADQNCNFDTFIVDSDSSDGTQEIVRKYNLSLTVINRSNFNHGGTRQLIVDNNPDYDIYVFLTQDVCLTRSDSLLNLVQPFNDLSVGAVCGRQIPHDDATPIAMHARYFNYPESTIAKSFADIPKYGIKTAFLSNSFAAYRGAALNSINGFPNHVIFAEDMYVAAKMLLKGWRIVYAGRAVCQHSHNYSFSQEFSRYFDMGVFHSREPWIRSTFGGAGGEGVRYLISEIKYLGILRIHLVPNAIFRNALKLIAYKIGQREAFIPIFIKRKIGMYKQYWNGPFASPTCSS